MLYEHWASERHQEKWKAGADGWNANELFIGMYMLIEALAALANKPIQLSPSWHSGSTQYLCAFKFWRCRLLLIGHPRLATNRENSAIMSHFASCEICKCIVQTIVQTQFPFCIFSSVKKTRHELWKTMKASECCSRISCSHMLLFFSRRRRRMTACARTATGNLV